MEQTRKLGQMENVLADRSAINNLIVTTILRTKDKLLDVNILKEAVFKTVKSQPNLNSVLRRCEKNNELYFTPLKEIHDYFEELSNTNSTESTTLIGRLHRPIRRLWSRICKDECRFS